MFCNLKRAWIAGLLMPVLISCSTYNSRMTKYYADLQNGKYKKAMNSLESNSLIHRERNELLYFFEKGRVYQLQRKFDSSNVYYNLADQFIETRKRTAGDILKANLTNPMMQTYLGEDFERFMMHFYKAINYSSLGMTDDAVVEARRITLAEQAQGDKFNNKDNRYSKDAFALNLQGMIYESAGDINNAFIAYRNAADVYLNADGKRYYDVSIPVQLQQDLLRTANQMGFTDEQQRYEKLFNTTLNNTRGEGGELVLFTEIGWSPAKKELNFVLTKNSDGVNGFYYIDSQGNSIFLPFNWGYYNIDENNDDVKNFRTFRVAIPAYEVRDRRTPVSTIVVNGNTYSTELAENINTIAVKTLEQRLLTELANALARQITKKLAEKGAEAAAKNIAKNNSNEKDEKKKEDKAESAAMITGLLVNLINTATEKADTRNWQSLPAYVNYVRVPLQKGENVITFDSGGKIRTIKIQGNGGLLLRSVLIR